VNPLRPILLCALTAGALGIGPLAAQDDASRTTIGGYGEIHYTNPTGPDSPGEVNVKRFVLYFGHAFSDRIAFRSELELEDASLEGGEDGGEIALEQAYLDYRLGETLTLRTGLVLVPVGIINETHEPPTFNGVARPMLERDLIPATWREVGIGIAGTASASAGLTYRAYLVNGLTADGFSGPTGLRGGRQGGKEATFANPSFTGRMEWARPGLRVGGSFWYGGSAAQDSTLGTGAFDAPILLLSGDVRFESGPWAARGVAAWVSVPDADAINARYGSDVGRHMLGGYVEGSFNLLHLLAPASSHRLSAFVRYEAYDTHHDAPAGTTRVSAYDRSYTTFGLGYKPLWNVVFKADYQLRRNASGAGEDEALAFGVGYQF
jgi:hypothetical protein